MDPMGEAEFHGWWVERPGEKASYRPLASEGVGCGEVRVHIHYTSLNYKDALALTGHGRILREFPLIPGVDLAGVVLESASPAFQPGDQVLATGCGLGEQRHGGFGRYARLPGEWLLPLPAGLGLRHAMAVGTAGLTSMLAIMALERHLRVEAERECLVTGATGGVGSFAIALLSRLGWRVVASTGRRQEEGYLLGLGAGEVIDRDALAQLPASPLGHERWGAAIDTVGGSTLASLLAQARRGGSIAVCGLVGGSTLQTSVYPFLLRGVNLLGIDSTWSPMESRAMAWNRIATILPSALIESIHTVAPLPEALRLAEALLSGQLRGRVVLEVPGR